MKVGDYVRYKKLIYHNQGVDDIRISKIKDIEDAIETGYNQKFIFFENGNGEYEDRIIKSSPNIIDLIEKKDIIKYHFNGSNYISEVFEYKNDLWVQNENNMFEISELNIKSIVTKEQFEAMQYKIGGNDDGTRDV